MLKWIASRLSSPDAPDHPLGDDKAIAAYLAALPTANPQETLRELNDWLDDPDNLFGRLPTGRAQCAVERLDEFAQGFAASYLQKLLADARSSRQVLTGTVLRNFLAGSHGCNLRLFEMLAADPPETQDKRLLARFAMRAMHAWVEIKKLNRMSYQAAEPSWWRTAHALLERTRALDIAHLTQPVYPQQQLLSSVAKEYQVALLFESAPLTNLAACEIEATDRLVRWIEPQSRLVDSPSTLTPFCILPADGNAPARWREGGDYDPETRFFGIGQGQNQLVQLRANLGREGKLPDWLAGTGCTQEQLLGLLQLLIANWSATPPSRQHPRMQAKGRIRVVNGLDMVRRMVAASEYAKSGRNLDYDSYLKTFLNRHRDHAVVTDAAPPPAPKTPMEMLQLLETAGDQQMMESWDIIDLSRGGLGARFSSRRPWLRIGALLAYRLDDQLEWRIGIIRRLGSSHGQPNAGLTVFHGTPQCSQIRMAAAGPDDPWQQRIRETSGLGWHDAVLVSAEAGLLLVPSGIFSPGRAVHISIEGRWRSAQLTRLHSRGNDYELVSYEADESGLSLA